MALEVEIKLPLTNAEIVENSLNKMADFLYEEHQVDYYFSPSHRNFIKDKTNILEWFRLRTVDGNNSLNYKDYSAYTHCTEYETKISSVEDMLKMLKALDFKNIITVDKLRKSWLLNDIEISIDNVSELGIFIELEYKGKKTDVDEIRTDLFSMLNDINASVGEEDKKGYPWLLLERI